MIMYKAKRTIIPIFVVSLLSGMGWCDVLQLTNGDRLVGVTDEDNMAKSTFVFRSTNGVLTLSRSKVSAWDKEPLEKGWVRMGDEYSRQNRVEKSLECYEKALSIAPNDAEAQGRVQEAQARMNDASLAQTADEDVLVSETETLNPNQAMDILARAVSAADNERYDDAAELLNKVTPASVAGAGEEFAVGASNIYLRWGLVRADHQDINTAIDHLKKSLFYNPNNEKATNALKKILDSESSRLAELSDIYKNDMTPTGRLKYAEALYRQKKYSEALPILLEFANDPENSTPVLRRRILNIYNTMHTECAERGDWQGALSAYNQLLVFDPSQTKDTLYKYEYMIRRGQTNQADPKARLALARYAESKGMLDTARQEYRSILEMQETNEDARKGLLAYAGRDLREVQNNLAAGETVKAREKANEIILDYPMFPEVVQAAQSVLLTAQSNERQGISEKASQAQRLVMQGDQYYNTAVNILMSASFTTRDANNRVFSVKQESVKNLRMAVSCWQKALQLDASLAQANNGNLNARIRDALQRIRQLTKNSPSFYPKDNDFKRI
ncbi:tetratricopeptide repeat protein [Candidatus Sumerlaeota bacterium]|nr:tetratricopeptide repeat protein [Candidatus Sumerlaeales bacterium]NLD62030.1 tetratricopeptide repeat protein [Candidatus Sumerlaeota bacterium]